MENLHLLCKHPCQISLVKRKAKEKVNALYLYNIRCLCRRCVYVGVGGGGGGTRCPLLQCKRWDLACPMSFTVLAICTRQVNAWLINVFRIFYVE